MSAMSRRRLIARRLAEVREWAARSLASLPQLGVGKLGDTDLIGLLPQTRLGLGSSVRKFEVLLPHLARAQPQAFVDQVLAHWLRHLGDHYGGRLMPTKSEDGCHVAFFRPLDNGHLGGVSLAPRMDGNVLVLELKYFALQSASSRSSLLTTIGSDGKGVEKAIHRVFLSEARQIYDDKNKSRDTGCFVMFVLAGSCLGVVSLSKWIFGENSSAINPWYIALATIVTTIILFRVIRWEAESRLADKLVQSAMTDLLTPAARPVENYLGVMDHKNLLERSSTVLDEIIQDVRTAYEST